MLVHDNNYLLNYRGLTGPSQILPSYLGTHCFFARNPGTIGLSAYKLVSMRIGFDYAKLVRNCIQSGLVASALLLYRNRIDDVISRDTNGYKMAVAQFLLVLFLYLRLSSKHRRKRAARERMRKLRQRRRYQNLARARKGRR